MQQLNQWCQQREMPLPQMKFEQIGSEWQCNSVFQQKAFQAKGDTKQMAKNNLAIQIMAQLQTNPVQTANPMQTTMEATIQADEVDIMKHHFIPCSVEVKWERSESIYRVTIMPFPNIYIEYDQSEYLILREQLAKDKTKIMVVQHDNYVNWFPKAVALHHGGAYPNYYASGSDECNDIARQFQALYK